MKKLKKFNENIWNDTSGIDYRRTIKLNQEDTPEVSSIDINLLKGELDKLSSNIDKLSRSELSSLMIKLDNVKGEIEQYLFKK